VEYVECITHIVAWFTPVWEEIQYNDGGQEWLLICACLWHLNLPYRSHNLLQVTDLKIQGLKQWYSYSMLWNSTATKPMQCMCCKDWSISQESIMLISWSKMGHVRGSLIYPPQLISCQQHVWLLRYSSVIAAWANIASVLWTTVCFPPVVSLLNMILHTDHLGLQLTSPWAQYYIICLI